MCYGNKLLLIIACFTGIFILSVVLGSVFVPPAAVWASITSHCGLSLPSPDLAGYDSIVWFVRMPRAITAACSGMALAVAGAFMQGIFRNPMADPGIIGVSSGASFGAVCCIALNLNAFSFWFMPLAAAAGALTAAATVITIARKDGRLPVLRLLLSGIATSMFFGAFTYTILMTVAGDKVRQFLFWTTGSFNSAVWENVWVVFLPLLLLLILTTPFLKNMNLLLIGDPQSWSLGINPEKNRMAFMFAASVLAAAAVCVGGNISFVGLIVPHICRSFSGSDYRKLIPLTAFGGAALLLLCDLLSRTVFNDLSVGIVTSLIGVPYFVLLLRKSC